MFSPAAGAQFPAPALNSSFLPMWMLPGSQHMAGFLSLTGETWSESALWLQPQHNPHCCGDLMKRIAEKRTVNLYLYGSHMNENV